MAAYYWEEDQGSPRGEELGFGISGEWGVKTEHPGLGHIDLASEGNGRVVNIHMMCSDAMILSSSSCRLGTLVTLSSSLSTHLHVSHIPSSRIPVKSNSPESHIPSGTPRNPLLSSYSSSPDSPIPP